MRGRLGWDAGFGSPLRSLGGEAGFFRGCCLARGFGFSDLGTTAYAPCVRSSLSREGNELLQSYIVACSTYGCLWLCESLQLPNHQSFLSDQSFVTTNISPIGQNPETSKRTRL